MSLLKLKHSLPSSNKTLKDFIVELLQDEWPLSARQISAKVAKSNFKQSVSPQAIYKSLHELLEQKIVTKNNDGFSLNVAWLDEVHEKASQLKGKYFNSAIAGAKNKEYYSLEFSTPLQMADFLFDYFFQYPNSEKYPLVCKWKHAYSTVGVSGKHLKVLQKITRENGMYALTTIHTVGDKYFANILKSLKVHILLGKLPELEHDTMVQGDYVCQIYWDKEFLNAWKKSYSVKHFKEFDFEEELKQMAVYEFSNRVIVFKNPELAQKIRNEILSEFKIKKKK